MARTEIRMPQLGETVTEGTITRWLKSVGEEVKADELLFEVSTDKVDSEVPSPVGGYLVEILVPEGETVAVGTPLAVIADTPAETGAQPAAPSVTEAAAAVEPAAATPAEAAAAAAPAEAPAPPTPIPEPESVTGPTVAPPATAPPPAAPPAAAPGDGMLLSPVVRRLVREHGLDPRQIPGTGAGGRVTRNDVLAFIERRQRGEAAPARPAPGPAEAPAAARPAPAPAEAPAAAEAPTPGGLHPGAPAEAQVVPMSNIRKRTAEHMVRSKATSPHVMMSIEVDFENVERVRQAHREEWRREEGFSLTYLPFIARAVCDAIADFPHVNASVEGDNLVVYPYVNLGIAVDLEFQGLIVPVVKNADALRFRPLARAIRDLAERARSKRLSPDEVTGGTYTITNPGPFGTFLSAPIINQPQVAILSTEGVAKRPVVIETPMGDTIAIHHVGYLSQSFDHRAFDGAYCASYLRRVKELLETRDWATELS